MKKMIENVLMLGLSCIIVVFLIYILLHGQFKQGEGVFGALENNPYTTQTSEINIKLTDSFKTTSTGGTSKLIYDDTVCYIYNYMDPTTITDLYSKISIECQGNIYTWNPSTLTWTNTSDPDNCCTVYIQDILNERDQSSYYLGLVSDLPEDIFYDVVIDDHNGETCFFSKGMYRFYIKVTDAVKNENYFTLYVPVTDK